MSDGEWNDMADEQYDEVLEFGVEERYSYFVSTVCGSEQVFYLVQGEEMPTMEDSETGRVAFPVWPHARLAAACADRGFEGTEPHVVPLGHWLDFCDQLDADEALVAVMMYPDDSFVRVEPRNLKRDLEAAAG